MGTRIKTSKAKPKPGCRNRAASIAVLAITLTLVVSGYTGTNCGGKPKTESCTITARDTLNVTLLCTDQDDNKTTVVKSAPSDLYHNCQVGTFWPGCKQD